ncbi:hypothetical protein AMECASPLE_012818 [Ameca splendens]|uniref:Uncharacterized protein n=1 Tax=Ameca splendens TaxID=208324 RepID=A0ABV0ZA18_9TELE
MQHGSIYLINPCVLPYNGSHNLEYKGDGFKIDIQCCAPGATDYFFDTWIKNFAHVGYFIDQPSLPNPWIRMPESASPFMTSLLCPNLRFKPLPWILLCDSVFPALTLFLFPDYCLLLSHWVCRPDSSCGVSLLLPDHHAEEPKFSFLILSQILKSSRSTMN